jgi:hypothetical protein
MKPDADESGVRPMVTNYSQCKRLARQLLGPAARVQNVDGHVTIYVHTADTRTVYGEGASYFEALNDCFVMDSEDASKNSEVLAELKSRSIESNAP